MPSPQAWTSPSQIRKRFLHSRGNLIRHDYILCCSTIKCVLMHNPCEEDPHASYNQCHSIISLFLISSSPSSLILRSLTLAASPLPYYLMILTTTCALLTKRCSAHLHTLRCPSPMRSSSTWESQKPSSSVPQVNQSLKPSHFLPSCHKANSYAHRRPLFIYVFIYLPETQSTVGHSATQVSLSPPTSTL